MSINTPEQNRCIHCGHELPEGASFCPFCETEQVASVPLQAPRRKKKLILSAIAVLLAASAILLAILLYRQPRTYEGTSTVPYRLGKDIVDVIVSFDSGSGNDGHLDADKSIELPSGTQDAHPIWLCVYSKEDPSLAASFAEQIESCTIEAVPVDAWDGNEETGSVPVEISGPNPIEDPSISAIWFGEIFFDSDNGKNELHWTITMKNRDQILLSQSITCSPLPVVNLHYSSTPLETVKDIMAAVASVDSNTILNLTLPPVIFDEPLDLTDRTVNLIGTSDEKNTTTFTETIKINNRIPTPAKLTNILLQGNGGIGLLTYECVLADHCSFRGWEIGFDAEEGSWPVIEDCIFEENDIGLRLNSTTCTASSDGCEDTVFTNNGIGACLLHVPADLPFEFPGCTFVGNKEDIEEGS